VTSACSILCLDGCELLHKGPRFLTLTLARRPCLRPFYFCWHRRPRQTTTAPLRNFQPNHRYARRDGSFGELPRPVSTRSQPWALVHGRLQIESRLPKPAHSPCDGGVRIKRRRQAAGRGGIRSRLPATVVRCTIFPGNRARLGESRSWEVSEQISTDDICLRGADRSDLGDCAWHHRVGTAT
jgi:hypothetical protein